MVSRLDEQLTLAARLYRKRAAIGMVIWSNMTQTPREDIEWAKLYENLVKIKRTLPKIRYGDAAVYNSTRNEKPKMKGKGEVKLQTKEGRRTRCKYSTSDVHSPIRILGRLSPLKISFHYYNEIIACGYRFNFSKRSELRLR